MGISVSAKCGKKTLKEVDGDVLDECPTRTLSAGVMRNILKLQIPPESFRSSYDSTCDEEDIQAVVEEEGVDVEKVKTNVEESSQIELDPCEWRPQIPNPEQASLSWACDIYSKESDQFALGWASQINSESINCSDNGGPKEPEKMTYSPLAENEFQELATPSMDDSRMKLIIEPVPPKPKDRKNFVRQNVKQVNSKKSLKNGSYSQLNLARIQPTVEIPPGIEQVSFANMPNSTNPPYAKLEYLLQEQRLDLIHAVDDFLRQHSQETTQRSELLEGVIKAKPLSQPKIPRRPVKLINFKKLDKFVERESKSGQQKDLNDELHKPWHHELISVMHDATSLKLPVSSETSIQAKEINSSVQKNGKFLTNSKKCKNAQFEDEPEKAKSKREIMMEYSKSVTAANSISGKKTTSNMQLKPQRRPASSLDKEIAKILQAHEAETQRIASLFLT